MRALLDVNVLIALLDENHTHHAAVSEWFRAGDRMGMGILPADAERLRADHLAAEVSERVGRSRSGGTPASGRIDAPSPVSSGRRQSARRCRRGSPPVAGTSPTDRRLSPRACGGAWRSAGDPRQIRVSGRGSRSERGIPRRNLTIAHDGPLPRAAPISVHRRTAPGAPEGVRLAEVGLTIARIVPPGGHHLDRIARPVDAPSGEAEDRGGLEGDAHRDVLTGRGAAEDPIRVVAEEPLG